MADSLWGYQVLALAFEADGKFGTKEKFEALARRLLSQGQLKALQNQAGYLLFG